MNALIGRLLDLLYPPKCAFCRKLVRDGRMLCPDCEKNLPAPEKELQVQQFPHLALCVSPLYYTGDVKKSLQRYKFHSAAAYCGIYGELMAECLKAHASGPANRYGMPPAAGKTGSQPRPVRDRQPGGADQKCAGRIPLHGRCCREADPAG